MLNWNLLHSLESSRVAKFAYCQPRTLKLTNRMSSAVRIVNRFKPDLACFQELDINLMTMLEPGLSACLVKGNVTLNESLPAKDGVGVYYNPEKFELRESKSVRFCDVLDDHIPTLVHASRTDQRPVSLVRALHREVREKLNMVVMVRLRELVTGNEFVVCSSHLFWDPKYPDIKLLQSYALAKCVIEFACDSPVVVGADLNSVPESSAVYELLMGSGSVSTSHAHHPATLRSKGTGPLMNATGPFPVPALSIGDPFMSAMKHINGREPEFTNYTDQFKGCLDYVLLRGGIRAVAAEPMPAESELAAETALPNFKYPSDHLPIVVDIQFPEP